ncbi:MAG TPA: ThuA domain-containing protein [Pirellulales bacterium]|nr:ThuA domain-containing protein [Pirellulales bacterium]
MKTKVALAAAIMISLPIGVGAARAIEPWADQALPVTEGLQAWYDATRLDAAAADLGSPAPRTREHLDLWRDGSCRRRDLKQPAPNARPKLRANLASGAGAAVRFDGVDDFLSATELNDRFDGFTIIVVGSARANPGGFRAFLEFNQAGANDYVTGLNLDLGAAGGDVWSRLNLEGAGFGGERNLLATPHEFGTFHAIAITSPERGDRVRLIADGAASSERPRGAGTLLMDELRLGARCYDNSGRPSTTSGFLDGEIAEALVYDRELTDDELAAVNRYLRRKHAPLFELRGLPPEPPLRMLAPGFIVKPLPVELTNVNDLAYLPDGRLLALGYDGRIHLLSDTDGDGLEDKVEPFWYEPTLRQPIAMTLAREGVYVTSHGKISLFPDADHDGRADREEIVATGWQQPQVSTNGVDAMGIALDREGNLFFGLGCADFTNAYLMKDGKAHYDIASERGTILKLGPQRDRRKIHCTGIRFPVTLAFNREGDLFCTDQEGATWLPGGNPLDELNHIIAGRHYGFPPRHAEHLPDVVDEPTVLAFGPQHQSTCGLVFNEATAERRSFGPEEWEGDALVSGFSRGKLWRSTLVKTPAGYVGRSTLIAASRMLLLETAVAPDGSLAVTCHGGPPDWGVGPPGPGKLFKIFYADHAAPQPVAAWPVGPLELRVAFDRPVDASLVESWRDAEIEYGDYVRPADRYESLRPPYAVVQQQLQTPRGKLRVAAARLSDDRRTLSLTTDPHGLRTSYSLMLPGLGSAAAADELPAIDLGYDLSGAAVEWVSADGRRRWSGWLPHLDLEVARRFTRGSAPHAELEKLLAERGLLTIRARLLLPAGATLSLSTDAACSASCGSAAGQTSGGAIELRPNDWSQELTIRRATGETKQSPSLQVSFKTGSDPTERPLPTESILLPWAPDRLPEPPPPAALPAELAGGDWNRGKEIFFGKEAKCSACHVRGGEGGKVGPDLSNLVHRDAASVLRDVTEPSAAINPDYVSYTLALEDGRVLTGVVRAEGADKIRVLDVDAKETIVATADVEELRPSALSLMPKGIAEQLGPEKLKHLLTFLLTVAPAPDVPPTKMPGAPPPRTRAEVEKALRAIAAEDLPPAKPRPIKIVLVAGPKDHGPGEHDYPRWQRVWSELLGKSPGVQVRTAYQWPEESQWASADLVVLFHMDQAYSDERLAQLDAYLARGGGLVLLHSAVIPAKEPEKLAARVGLAWQWQTTKFRHGDLDLALPQPEHPIVRGLPAMHFKDESYWPLLGDVKAVTLLGTTVEDGAAQPMLWTFEPGKDRGSKGRVFVSILGHYSWTFDDPLFRVMLLRGMAWTMREPLGRFNSLATDGVELAD